MTKRYLGEALPKRPDQKTNKLSDNGGFISNLEGVSVDVRTIESGGSYTMPTLNGVEFDRMRRYGLVLNRWSVADRAKRAKRNGYPVSAYVAASRAVSNHMFRQVFDGEDPTTDTVNITPYVNAIKAGMVTEDLLLAVAGLHGTGAFDAILRNLPHKGAAGIVRQQMSEMSDTLNSHYLGPKAHYWSYINGIHSTSKSAQRRAYGYYDVIAQHLLYHARSAGKQIAKDNESKTSAGKSRQDDKGGDKNTRSTNGIPNKKVIKLSDEDDWQTPYLAKYPLELPHTGKLGRREIATNEGKYPKAFHRLVTDPYRRIFKRKTRALGGVVVFDCSGSMGLTEDDIHKVLKASAGCSILCYSASPDEDDDRRDGNIHLVAKNGRQMRGLPDFPGGNGVDLPALRYGVEHLRQNGRSPVIWVSDGQVTGKGDSSSADLRRETTQYCRKHNITRVEDPNEAIKLLAKLQKGLRS